MPKYVREESQFIFYIFALHFFYRAEQSQRKYSQLQEKEVNAKASHHCQRKECQIIIISVCLSAEDAWGGCTTVYPVLSLV
jgi:hypothetical protein